MSILYLIRHAQASFGQENYDCLSNLGQQQATILAGHFQNLGLEFDAVYSGSQVRHEQTADACRDNADTAENQFPAVIKMDAFNEYDSENILKTLIPEMIREEPAFESEVAAMMQDKRSFQQVYEKIMRRWVNSKQPIEQLETWKSYSHRVTAGLQKIMTAEGSKKKVAVFTSGGPISVCVQKALNLSDDHTLQITWQIMNASVTRLKYSGNRLMLFGFNDVTHLELQKDAQLLTHR